MTRRHGTPAYERLHAAREAKEHERDAIAAEVGVDGAIRSVDRLDLVRQAEWDTANSEANDLKAAEESVRSNQQLD